MCAGTLVKCGVKVTEVTSCKAIINLRMFEAFKFLTFYYLIFNDVSILATVWLTYLFMHKIYTTKNSINIPCNNYFYYQFFKTLLFVDISCNSHPFFSVLEFR